MKVREACKRLFTKRFKIGMRTMKTVCAVFICCVVDTLRGSVPLLSTMAAIICIQPDTENTVNEALSRILATLLGGFGATLLVIGLAHANTTIHPLLYYATLSVLLIPIIVITVKMGWPSAAAPTCIIFLSIALGYNSESDVLRVALNRMIDTVVGVMVALPINMIFPFKAPNSASAIRRFGLRKQGANVRRIRRKR